MTSRPSKSEVKQAMFDERQKLKGTADIFDDSSAVETALSTGTRPGSQSWERLYDALGR
ncbi:hypothetical protein [Paracoccus laeviglucosivorans]|uniref:Uncharacterized protein n=1 Tax=Paracoccus laeviglucosivorans TaxID=1197861 RepID=A0A521ET01_9RHOB|nr:hypothetical protein [Paracoccus laeviglucosivorans]SMO87049.1 hypothetical protein SAMN06265221_11558 [Paracoccus laeviglucosivorans]